ncbi:hypothetical protein CFP56_006820 [Quercus suber]|uniref:Uncharacterized protein n=1 Tax=Quercus suber TaxID=58331 RepID=A0AAW0M5Y6_QUESU
MESPSNQAFDSDESEKCLQIESFVEHEFADYDLSKDDEKDQRIRELTLELSNERQRCKRRCAAYQEQLHMVLKYIEEHTDHMSRRVQDIVQNVRELEEEEQQDSDL